MATRRTHRLGCAVALPVSLLIWIGLAGLALVLAYHLL
jgi:hypothetical protein